MKKITFVERLFSYAAPNVWGKLSKTVKSSAKTKNSYFYLVMFEFYVMFSILIYLRCFMYLPKEIIIGMILSISEAKRYGTV